MWCYCVLCRVLLWFFVGFLGGYMYFEFVKILFVLLRICGDVGGPLLLG